MYKNLKKAVSLMSIFCLVFFLSARVFAAGNEIPEVNSVRLVQKAVDESGYEATVSQLTGDEEIEIWNKIDLKLQNVGFYKELFERGYEISNDYSVHPVKITDNEMPDLNVYYFMNIYINSEEELAGALFAYDEKTNSLLRVEANKVSEDGNMEKIFNYSEYNASLQRDFSVWGANFACGMAGVVACGAYCAMLGAAAVPAGLTCSIICGTAFAAACA